MSTVALSAAYGGGIRISICCGVQDVFPEGTSDSTILKWAAAENRVLVTNDRNTMVASAYDRFTAGESVPGVIVTTNAQAVGSAIDDILLIAECMTATEISSRIVVFLPFAPSFPEPATVPAPT